MPDWRCFHCSSGSNMYIIKPIIEFRDTQNEHISRRCIVLIPCDSDCLYMNVHSLKIILIYTHQHCEENEGYNVCSDLQVNSHEMYMFNSLGEISKNSYKRNNIKYRNIYFA